MIPKIVHQTWKTDSLPSIFQAIYNNNKETNPNFEFKLWHDTPGTTDIEQFMKTEYKELYDIFNKCKYGVQKADISRIVLLYHYGGVYIDLDILTLKKLDELIDFDSDFFYVSMEPKEQTKMLYQKDNMVCNAFFATPAKHPVMQKALEQIVRIWKNNGDQIMNKFNIFGTDIISYAMTCSTDIYSQCKIINRDLIYPINDPKLEQLECSEKTIKLLKEGVYPGSYMIHYWIHSNFESIQLLHNFQYNKNNTIHENIFNFFKQLYPSHKYLRI